MDRHRRRATFGITFCLLLIVTRSVAQQNAAPDRDFYYYSGKVRVDIAVARDELGVLPADERLWRSSLLSAIGADARISATAMSDIFVKYRSGSPDLASLAERARAIADTGRVPAAVIYPAGAPQMLELRGSLTRSIAIKVNGEAPIEDIAAAYGLRSVEPVDYSAGTYVAKVAGDGLFDAIEVANAIFEDGLAEFATPLVRRGRSKRLIPSDPLFSDQWHLQNTGQVPGVVGEDVNIVGAWDSYNGAGINIAITDTGVLVTHPDLAPNARTDIDIDLNGNDNDPTPQADPHGTNAAGIAAAQGNNLIGVTGAAFEAGIVGIRFLEGFTDDQDEADAMNHQVGAVNPANFVHINSNSWGPCDSCSTLGDAGPLVIAALANGTTNGRGGKGTVYVWAAGNGLQFDDNINFDPYASSRFTIAVGATGANGTSSYYSEKGAPMLVNASSSDTFSGTTTTDYPSDYTNAFGGTSSAAPLAAGVIALMLEANPELGWRDVQHVLVDSAEKNDPSHVDWKMNGAGRLFNHFYGFGRIDATAAVALAETWEPVPAYATPVPASNNTAGAIPDNDSTGLSRTVTISGAPADFYIERIEVVTNITHPSRGQLFIVLTAPSGFKSELASVNGDIGSNYTNWQFTTVGHWGENPNGLWDLTVKDLEAGFSGTLNNWSIVFHGFHADDWAMTQPPDTDQDLLSDDDEINVYGTDPNDPDSDDDGVIDGIEVDLGTDPLDGGDFPLLSVERAPNRWLLCTIVLLLSFNVIRRASVRLNRSKLNRK